jgi:hypothetical protein
MAWMMFAANTLRQLAAPAPASLSPGSREVPESGAVSRGSPHRKIPIHSWGEFVRQVSSGAFKNWAFRGQQDATWPMESSLSRHLLTRHIHQSLWREQEERTIRIFRRKAHLFLQHLPGSDDIFEWVALMQHHGAPTRLLDFTWSPYVAAFFALEHARGDAAIWAVNPQELYRRQPPGRRHLPPKMIDGYSEVSTSPRQKGIFERVYLPGTAAIAQLAEPLMMNQRLIAQQGTFLIPGRLDQPVEVILQEYGDCDSLLVQFTLSPDVRDEAMRELLNMNITNATLFPGLDGLAHSITYELEFSWAFNLLSGESLRRSSPAR